MRSRCTAERCDRSEGRSALLANPRNEQVAWDVAMCQAVGARCCYPKGGVAMASGDPADEGIGRGSGLAQVRPIRADRVVAADDIANLVSQCVRIAFGAAALGVEHAIRTLSESAPGRK